VDEADIRQVLADMTGIPLTRLAEGEGERLVHLEETLHKAIVGQDDAVSRVAACLRRSRAGVSSPKRPMGSFIFLGPTGVGKTLLAKKLAEYLFGNEDSLLRIDMSDYMEKYNVSRLVGAPPGYIGYEEGGVLTERIRRNPYRVVLFDEIEKAAPEVFNVFLQLLDDGRLTDSQGRVVDFKNVIIIMTSNLGSDLILEEAEDEKATRGSAAKSKKEADLKNALMELLKKSFRPEFLNRIDETVIFNRLGKNEISKIIDIQLSQLEERLAERKITLRLSANAKQLIADRGYDPLFGARPLKREIQADLENTLAKLIIGGKIKDGDTVSADKNSDEKSADALSFKRSAGK
jgi:ATP-dependent Clp protease ATP-binding subunit ClpB